MLKCMIKGLISIILPFKFKVFLVFTFIFVYRTHGILQCSQSLASNNPLRERNLPYIPTNKTFHSPYWGKGTYFFINKQINFNNNPVFKIEATKGKSTTSGKGKTGEPKARPSLKNAPKKKEKRISKSELGAMKARAKMPKKPKKPQTMSKAKITLQEEDMEEIEKEYRRRIAVTDTQSYREKIEMDLYLDKSIPYMALFDSEKITKEDLVGFDMPFGLVPRERYELWKLCGRISDPLKPFSSQSLTTRIFTDRLFGKDYEISRDEFNYKIEYKMKFYTPGYGEIFFMDKVRCWRAWYLVRGCKYGPEDLPTYTTIYPLERPKDSIPLSHVMLAVNCEVNRQGVHPALLDMLWNFFTDDPKVLTRDLVTYKLNWMIDRLENLDPGEGISPDNFYRIFYEPCKEALSKFDKEEFLRNQLRNLNEISTHKMLMMNNKALRVRNKILREAYNEELKNLYKTVYPRTYVRYERTRLAGYFNMLHHMHEMRERKKLWPKEKKVVMSPEEMEERKHELLLEKEVQKYTKEEQRKQEMKRRKALRARKKKK